MYIPKNLYVLEKITAPEQINGETLVYDIPSKPAPLDFMTNRLDIAAAQAGTAVFTSGFVTTISTWMLSKALSFPVSSMMIQIVMPIAMSGGMATASTGIVSCLAPKSEQRTHIVKGYKNNLIFQGLNAAQALTLPISTSEKMVVGAILGATGVATTALDIYVEERQRKKQNFQDIVSEAITYSNDILEYTTEILGGEKKVSLSPRFHYEDLEKKVDRAFPSISKWNPSIWLDPEAGKKNRLKREEFLDNTSRFRARYADRGVKENLILAAA